MAFTGQATDLAVCDIVYIAADVPTDDTGTSHLDGIRTLIDTVIAHLRSGAVLVVLCQVPPGFTRDLPLEKGRLYYQVETLIFGRAVERAMYPERTIVGCADPAAPLPAAYRMLLESFDCPILPMRYESAELAKISINCCLVASISVANTLGELCEKIGADWSEIAPALKLDKRIGAHAYLSPGLGIAGGNLERDLATVIRFADGHGSDAGVVEAWVANSSHRRDWAIRALGEAGLDIDPATRIAVLGLAYKENTHSIKNSPSLALLRHLEYADVTVFDPVVAPKVVPFAKGADSALAAVDGADVVCVMTPWPEFRNLSLSDMVAAMRGRVMLDPYRMFDCKRVAAEGLDYYTLGMPPMLAATDKGG